MSCYTDSKLSQYAGSSTSDWQTLVCWLVLGLSDFATEHGGCILFVFYAGVAFLVFHLAASLATFPEGLSWAYCVECLEHAS